MEAAGEEDSASDELNEAELDSDDDSADEFAIPKKSTFKAKRSSASEDGSEEEGSEESESVYEDFTDQDRPGKHLMRMAKSHETTPEDTEALKEASKLMIKAELEKAKVEFEEDGDILGIEEEKLDEIIDKIVTMNFPTEEDMINFFDEQYKKAIKRTRYRWRKKKHNKSNIWQSASVPAGEDYLNKTNTYERGGESMFLDEWFMDKRNLFIEWDRQQNLIGKYPQGFRHFENYVNYRQVFPDSTIEDYIKEMNREVTYPEFMNIIKAFITQHTRTNYWKQQHFGDLEDIDGETMEEKRQ